MKISKQVLNIVVRYLILILVAIPNLWIFYIVFTPLTIYPLYFIFSIFLETSLIGNILLIERVFPIELIPACIAGAAYYLILILNLSVPKIQLKKRINMIAFTFLIFLIINILRIFFLALLFISGSNYFTLAHEIFWHLLSTIFVVGIWFLEIKVFKIKQIPIYSDLKNLKKILYKN